MVLVSILLSILSSIGEIKHLIIVTNTKYIHRRELRHRRDIPIRLCKMSVFPFLSDGGHATLKMLKSFIGITLILSII